MFDEVSNFRFSLQKDCIIRFLRMGRRRVDAYLGERLHDSRRNHGLRAVIRNATPDEATGAAVRALKEASCKRIK